jgi:glycosyltransferase involved in cell wall biosynthesis
MTTISIAMATYNGAKFIREQLDSLAAQTVLPCELVVTDDGSTDKTLEIIADFLVRAPFPVHIHRNAQRLNYRANFMQCANRCSGDLIAFCDQDDIWDQDKLATLVDHFDNAAEDLIFHDFRVVDANGNPVMSEPVPASLDRWTVVRGLTQAFRRTLLMYSDLWELSVDHLNPTEHLAHDQWFVFLAHSFNSIHHLSQPLLSYRVHAGNLYGVPEANKTTNLTVITRAIFGQPDLARARRSLFHRHYLGHGLASIGRMNVLKEIYQRERSICEPHILEQIEFYSACANSSILRRSIYEHAILTARLMSFFYAFKGGAYNLNARGVKDAILDMFYGILLAPSSELYPISQLPEIPLTYPRHSSHQIVGSIEKIGDEEESVHGRSDRPGEYVIGRQG